jgi:hypothetical protein
MDVGPICLINLYGLFQKHYPFCANWICCAVSVCNQSEIIFYKLLSNNHLQALQTQYWKFSNTTRFQKDNV